MTKTRKESFYKRKLFNSRIKSANVKIPELVFGYFLGPFLALISNAIFASYLNQYFNNVLGISSYSVVFATLMPMVSVIFVIAGNIIVGRLIDKTRTAQGKARPYLLISIPLVIVAIVLLFIGPTTNSIVQLIWVTISYNVYYSIAYPLYYASHSSMVGLSTRNSKHRGLLATFSNASGVAAVGVGASIIFPLFQGYLFVQNIDGTTDILSSYNAWRIFILALCAITLIGIIIEYYFTRERITEENIKLEIKEKKRTSFEQLKAVVSSKDWWIIILFFFLFQFGGLIKNGSMGYYCYAMFGAETVAEAGTYQSLLGLIGGIPTAIGMVIAWPIAAKLGKKNSIVIGFIIAVIGGLISFIDVSNFYLVCAGVVLKGIGSIPAMYVSLALLSDVLDHLEAKNGFRSDGFTMAVYGSIMVGLTGLGTGIVNAVLGLGGYDFTTLCIQSTSAKIAVVICFLVVELVCYALLIFLVPFIKVEKHIDEDHKIILNNQKQKVLNNGGKWITPEERMIREQKEFDRLAETSRINELKLKCQKKGLDFEKEEKKYQDKLKKRKKKFHL